MLNKLLNIYNIKNFKPLIEYINMLDSGNIKIIDDINNGICSRTITLKINNIKFNIIVLNDKDKLWISFNRYNSFNKKVEIKDFVIYLDKYIEKQMIINKNLEYSRIIRYSAIKYDGNVSKIINYCIKYLNNNLVSGHLNRKIINYKDKNKLTPVSNLADVLCYIENDNIYMCEEYENIISNPKKLELYY